jgi:hypothetical protein
VSRFERAAIELIGYGFHVHPLRPRGKTPLTRHGFKDATRDERQILRWWSSTPDANIGVACGASGIAVLDIDSKSGVDPDEILGEFDLAGAPVVRTGEAPEPSEKHPKSLAGLRGGQVYFRGKIPTTSKIALEGCEIKGVGGYVIAPPSVHHSGVEYVGVLPPARELPAAPRWLLQLIPVASTGPREPADPKQWLTIVAGVQEGQRNNQLARFVGHLLRRYVDVDLVAELAHLVNETRFRPPLSRAEADKIIDSIADCEVRRRAGTA